MSRSRRTLAWSLVLVLLCAFFVAAQPPVARAAGSTFTVTTTSDHFNDPNEGCSPTTDQNNLPGCTLRQALNSANLAGNAGSTIEFQIQRDDPGYTNFATTGHDAWIITPTVALPPLLNDGTIVDGSTQTNRVGNDNNDGAEIIIDGAHVTNAGGLWIQSNGNTIRGIGIVNFRASGSSGTLKGVGIEISGDNNTIQGNYIGLGTAPNGTIAVPNIDAGIIIYGKGNLIGGDATALTTQFNVISGNSGDGILVNGGDNNNIAGNFIGTDGAVSTAIPNGGNGINIRNGGNGNVIGNYLSASLVSYRNFISGNNGYGIQIKDSLNNKIYGNFIGLNKSGISKISNGLGGIRIDGTSTNSSTGNVVGATAPNPLFMRNYIAGSSGPGIQLNGFGARQSQIVANYVGVGSSGQVPGSAPQLSTGILLDDGASDNTIGGSIGALGQNVVAGISGDGIRVAGLFLASPLTILRAQNNVVSGNYVGIAPNGTISPQFANSGSGIVLDTYVVNATVGGTSADQQNIVENNALDGITIRGTNVTTTTIQKNTLKFNTGNGISISGASNTKIDGGDAAGANQITNNGANGIRVTNSLTTTIQFNTLNFNVQNGVQVGGILTKNTIVNANTINVNTQNGVQLDTQAFNTAITGNTIYTNTLKGVLVRDVGTQRAKITANSMQGNRTGGIDLTPDTTWPPNSPTPVGDPNNPNHDIDPPYNIHVDQAGNLTGRVRVTPTNPAAAACVGCTVQVFSANPTTLDRQGRDKINMAVAVGGDGSFSTNIGSVPAQLALTATDQGGNTSEFAVLTRTLGLDIGPSLVGSAIPGQVITYTHRITNTGSIDFNNIQFTALSEHGWSYKLAPSNPIAVAAGDSKPVTLTLTLPKGPDSRVLANLIEHTRLTASAATPSLGVTTSASVTDTTTVLPQFILDISPGNSSGFGVPKGTSNFFHTLTNNGNIAGTVQITATTELGWATSVSTTTVQLAPGAASARSVTIGVAIPEATAAGTVVTTTVRFTVVGDPSQNKVISDTTTVQLSPSVLLIHAGDADGQAQAGQKISFRYTVENRSNGPATFYLAGVPSFGGTKVKFQRLDGQLLGTNNSFLIGNQPGSNQLSIVAEVTVDSQLLRGDVETVTIFLLDSQGRTYAAEQDKIFVTKSAFVPRAYLPIASK